jgi:hypothetical protein
MPEIQCGLAGAILTRIRNAKAWRYSHFPLEDLAAF